MTRNRWILLAAAVAFAGAALLGQKAGDQDPYLKVAAARAKVEIAIRDGAAVFDNERSGWNTDWRGCELAVQQTQQVLGRAREEENRKPKDKNDEFIKDCDQKSNAISEAWTLFNQKERYLPQVRLGDVGAQFNNAVQAFHYVAAGEENWKNGKMDLDLLVTVYSAMQERLTQTSALGQAQLDEEKNQCKRWNRELKNAVDFVTAAGHPPPARENN